MQQLANLDCFYLAQEMHARLAGSFLENVYDYGEERGVFRLRFSKESVLIDLKGFAFIAEKFPEAPKRPSSFAMLLRKHLSSAKLATVKQAGFDRIIEFTFSTKNGSKTLIVELFGKQGNLLFLDENRKIIMPFKREEYAARKLARAETYSLPPSEKKHPLELVESDFDGGKGKIVSFLSNQTSLAPFYLEEACMRASIGLEEKIENLSPKQKEALIGSLKTLFENPSPTAYMKDGKPIAFSSVEMDKLDKTEAKRFQTHSEAFAEYYENAEEKAPAGREGKVEFQLKSQEQALAQFDAKEAEAQAAGKWVFENTELVEELLALAKQKNSGALSKLAGKHGLNARIEKQVLEVEKAC
ncbi:TPA: hypothetical protein HA244_01685 [Candidatus Micrarchaeota archaeon]|nr:hypothetical protein [Candidatus Micrarchaeota archaeon]